MSLTTEMWKKIDGCLLRLYQELDVERHSHLMLEIVNELVPADSIALNYFTPPAKLTGITLPKNFATQEQINMVGKYGYQSPLGVYYTATQDASWKMITDFMPIEEFHKLDFHRLGLKPMRINFQLGGILLTMGKTAHIMTIHRTDENFTEREREILNTLHPHLVTSYVNAFAFTQAQTSTEQIRTAIGTAPGAYGYFGQDEKMAWLQTKAESWLHEFFPNELKDGEKIPYPVNDLVQKFFAHQCVPKQLEKIHGEEALTVCVGGSPVGGVIMRLDRKPSKPRPRFHRMPQITDRENEVLQWMSEGKRNGEISVLLHISERTVEKHVEQILAKLHVENRATAIIRAMEFSAGANSGLLGG